MPALCCVCGGSVIIIIRGGGTPLLKAESLREGMQ